MVDQTVQAKFTVLGGAKEVLVGLTRKPITAWAGLAMFTAFGEAVGLRAALDQALAVLPRTSPNALPASDLVLGFIAGVLRGAKRFLHLEQLRADEPVRSMFGVKRFVTPTSYTRFFGGFTADLSEAVFGSLTRWWLARTPTREKGYTLDLDSTVLERYGEQEGAEVGYNPKKRGRPSHHPLFAGLAELRWILHVWLRPGNVCASNHVIHFLSECLALAKDLVDITLVRADNGFFDGAFLRYLEDEARLPYLVKARFTHMVKRSVYESSFWTPVYRGTDVSEAIVQLQGWDRVRRLVLIRHAVKEDEAKAPGRKLFEWQGYRFQAIVTSFAMHEMSAVAVYRTYNQRGEFENRIKELKAGCGLNGFCLDSFVGTEAALRVLCLVHNLVQDFQTAIGFRPADVAKDQGQRYTLETLRHTLFCCAAMLGKKGRNLVLRLSATDPLFDRFLKALQRLLPASPKCIAMNSRMLSGQPPLPLFS